jgi:hypothetical protein
MKRFLLPVVVVFAAGLVSTAGHSETRTDVTALADQVRETERAFAKTMTDRDHAAFISFLADETIFLGDPQTLRGKTASPRRGKRSTTARQCRSRGSRSAWRCWIRARSR